MMMMMMMMMTNKPIITISNDNIFTLFLTLGIFTPEGEKD